MSLNETKDRYKLFNSSELKHVASLEATLLRGARAWLNDNDFTEVIPPHIVSATGSCELIETLFSIPYFGKQAYLTQTAQLYLEALVPFLGGKVFCIGPSFRAEAKADDRHLTEFSLIELEFEGDFQLLLSTIESLFKRMMTTVVNTFPETYDWLSEIKYPFKRISYEEALYTLDGFWGMDTRAEDEQKLIQMNDNQPIFLTHYPKELKYFNMRENDEDPKVVNSADLILPKSGESAGCAEREFIPTQLARRLKESGMYHQYIAKGGDASAFDWYLNLYYKYRPKLHSGFGMGLNRVTKFVLQLDDIRATTVYPMNSETLY